MIWMFSIYNYLITLPTVRDVYLSGPGCDDILLKTKCSKGTKDKKNSDVVINSKNIFLHPITKLLRHVRHCIKSKKDHCRQIRC